MNKNTNRIVAAIQVGPLTGSAALAAGAAGAGSAGGLGGAISSLFGGIGGKAGAGAKPGAPNAFNSIFSVLGPTVAAGFAGSQTGGTTGALLGGAGGFASGLAGLGGLTGAGGAALFPALAAIAPPLAIAGFALTIASMFTSSQKKVTNEFKEELIHIAPKIDISNKLLAVINHNFVALKNSIESYILPNSAYFSQARSLSDEFSIQASQGLA